MNMEMRTRISTIVFLSAFAALVGTVTAQQAGTPSGALSIASLSISPQPVLPGDNITIQFQLYNSYQSSLQNVDLALTGSYPLLNYSPVGTQLISSVGTGLYGGTIFFTYHVPIPKHIQAGSYTLTLQASYSAGVGLQTNVPGTSSMPITIYISGKPSLALNANPTNSIVPGQQFGVEINTLNTGTGSANNATMTILNSKNFTVVGSSTYYLGTVNSLASVSEMATLQANKSFALGKTSSIPIILNYSAVNGSIVSTRANVPLAVLVNNPNIVVSITGATPQTLYSGSNQTLSLLIQNIGTGVAKNVTLSFPSNPNLTVGSSASYIFVGSLAPGAQQNQNVYIVASKEDTKTRYNLPVQITYTDASYTNETNKTQSLGITLQSSAIFNITGINDSLQAGQTYVPVKVTVKNIGNEAAQHVTMSLQTIYPIAPVNTNAYINTLAPGNSTTVTFYVNVDAQGNAGQYPITLYEQWTQPNGATNEQYSGSNNNAAVVYTAGSGSNSYLEYGIVAIVIIVVAVVLMRRMQAQKAGKKEKK